MKYFLQVEIYFTNREVPYTFTIPITEKLTTSELAETVNFYSGRKDSDNFHFVYEDSAIAVKDTSKIDYATAFQFSE